MEDRVCDEKHKRIDERLDDIERRLGGHSKKLDILIENKIAVDGKIERLCSKIEDLVGGVNKLMNKMDILESKPGKNWDNLTKVITTVIVTAAITYFISKK